MNKIIDKIIMIPTIAVIFILTLTDHLSIKCPFHEITKLYCPGCGITRCLISIIKLDFYQAFRYNPLVFILLPFLIPYFIYKIYIFFLNKDDKITKKIPNFVYYILLGIIILFWIARNIDAFSWLAPTKIH